jgi:hypothetical protein
MNRLIQLGLCSLALCPVFVGLVPAAAEAEELPVKEWAFQRVTHGLLKPLAKKEESRSKFSRGAMPPSERRLRVVSETVSYDKQERAFLSYVVEASDGQDWYSELVGCVYRKTGEIFVQRGEEYRPAAFLLGKNVKAVAGVCQEAPAEDRS